MELPEPKAPQNRMTQMARTYSEAIRISITIVGWSLVAFVVGCAAFVVVEVTWKIVDMIRQAFNGL
ncbi:hypothetical protein ACFL5F_03250 [Planctomycetota bacterium]